MKNKPVKVSNRPPKAAKQVVRKPNKISKKRSVKVGSSNVSGRMDSAIANREGSNPSAATYFNNVLTASRMTAAMQCLRKHFWSYEIGLRKTEEGLALRIGSAWARAMEARWNGKPYEAALADAVPAGVRLNDYDMATISALLAAYYDYHGQSESEGRVHPEVQFRSELGDGVFTCEGKMDGLGSLADGRSVIIESKTTSDSLAPDSNYWLRLSFNLQVYQYVSEARKLGWDVATCFYDVTRKPMIQPKSVNDLDERGLKIVEDAAGVRQFRKDGVTPIQSGDTEKGWTIKSHIETPEEFCDRLYKDCLARPEFYFARKEVPIIDQQIESFERQRMAIARIIKSIRLNESLPHQRDPEAWPRNVSEHTCDFCQFKSFCLQNLSVDLKNPPEGFTVAGFNPELNTTK